MELVDTSRLSSWLDDEGLEAGEPVSIKELAGGTSNAMFIVQRGRSTWVLRRPRQVMMTRANDGMRREFRILTALDETSVPHPRVIALCEDDQVLGCTFYLMEQVDGISPISLPRMLDNEVQRREIGVAIIDALARIHEVDWRTVGLENLGFPESFHHRQVNRWSRQLASYESRALPGIAPVMQWLEANRPETIEPTIMHGDYHPMNILVARDLPGRVLAVLDWETATIGDPLLDLAGFRERWEGAARIGWPTWSDLVEHYQSVREMQIGDLLYYQVLYNFRLAVLQEGIFQRSLSDSTQPDQNEAGERAVANVARATDLLSGR